MASTLSACVGVEKGPLVTVAEAEAAVSKAQETARQSQQQTLHSCNAEWIKRSGGFPLYAWCGTCLLPYNVARICIRVDTHGQVTNRLPTPTNSLLICVSNFSTRQLFWPMEYSVSLSITIRTDFTSLGSLLHPLPTLCHGSLPKQAFARTCAAEVMLT